MNEISMQQLFELYLDTLNRCNDETLKKSDEDVEYDILEEFNVGSWSFLHDSTLQKLYEAGLINDELLTLSKELRELTLAIPESKWTIEYIRIDDQWKQVMNCSSFILNKMNIV